MGEFALNNVHLLQTFIERAMAGGASGKASGAAAAMTVEDTGEDAAWGEEADLILDEGTSQNLHQWLRYEPVIVHVSFVLSLLPV